MNEDVILPYNLVEVLFKKYAVIIHNTTKGDIIFDGDCLCCGSHYNVDFKFIDPNIFYFECFNCGKVIKEEINSFSVIQDITNFGEKPFEKYYNELKDNWFK